jgi:hypothetical protein
MAAYSTRQGDLLKQDNNESIKIKQKKGQGNEGG